jgi:hypothetical protein
MHRFIHIVWLCTLIVCVIGWRAVNAVPPPSSHSISSSSSSSSTAGGPITIFPTSGNDIVTLEIDAQPQSLDGVYPSSATPFFTVSTPMPSPPVPPPSTPSPFTVSFASLGVSSLLGHCRGFALPGAVRYCAHPGDTLDVQVEIDVRQQQTVTSNEQWPTHSLMSTASIELIVDSPSAMIFTPSTLLPVLSSPFAVSSSSSDPNLLQFRGLVRTSTTRLGVFNVSFALHPVDLVHLTPNDTAAFSLEVMTH